MVHHKKSIEAKVITLKELLKNYKFQIPPFQRPYTWEPEQQGDLIDDILFYSQLAEQPNDQQFLGNIIVQKTNEKNLVNVIDGQQRLITLYVILIYIYDEMKSNGKNVVALEELLLENNNLKFKNNDMLNKTLQHIYDEHKNASNKQELPEKAKKIIDKCKKTFSDGTLKNVQKAIENYSVIITILENEVHANSIFEVLNARGKTLNQMELLKNFIYKHSEPKYYNDTFGEQWKKIINNVRPCKSNESVLNDFLFIFVTCNIFTNARHSNNKLYRILSKNTDTKPKSMEKLTKNLLEMSEVFRDIQYKKKTDQIHKLLDSFGVKQIDVLLCALWFQRKRNKLKENNYEEIVKQLAYFHFWWLKVCVGKTNVLTNTISKYSYYIYNAKNEQSIMLYCAYIVKSMKELLEDEFPENLTLNINDKKDKFSYSNKSSARNRSQNSAYIVSLLSIIYDDYNSKEKNIDTEITIEHLKNDDSKNKETWLINNLTLCRKSLNQELNNKPTNEKMNILKKSELNINKSLCKLYKDEGENLEKVLESRLMEIQTLIEEKFQLKFPDYIKEQECNYKKAHEDFVNIEKDLKELGKNKILIKAVLDYCFKNPFNYYKKEELDKLDDEKIKEAFKEINEYRNKRLG